MGAWVVCVGVWISLARVLSRGAVFLAAPQRDLPGRGQQVVAVLAGCLCACLDKTELDESLQVWAQRCGGFSGPLCQVVNVPVLSSGELAEHC